MGDLGREHLRLVGLALHWLIVGLNFLRCFLKLIINVYTYGELIGLGIYNFSWLFGAGSWLPAVWGHHAPDNFPTPLANTEFIHVFIRQGIHISNRTSASIRAFISSLDPHSR